jgi:hypothetical protein
VVRGRKLYVDAELIAARLTSPEYIDELFELPDGGSFTLFSWRDPANPRRLGTGFKIGGNSGRPRLLWVRDRDLSRGVCELRKALPALVERYGEFVRLLPWL